MRPTLTLTLKGDGGEVRALAELEHEPWAAQDGEPWVAAFVVRTGLEQAQKIELSVAPDIAVALRIPAREGGPAGRRPGRAQDLDRLNVKLAAAGEALGRERERRAAADLALEHERTENRALRAALGKFRAQLDLARAAQTEAAATAAELETARRDLLETQRRNDDLTREHEQIVEAHVRATSALDERSAASLSRSAPAAGRPQRPVNRSLTHRTHWLGRAFALLVLLGVIAAIVLVVNTTVSR